MAAEFLQNQQQHQQQQPDMMKNDTIAREQQQRSVPIKMIGNYTLQQSIGKGSMGKVKLATHNVTGEKIAIKIVPRANLQILNAPNHHTNGKSIQQIAKEKAREENREVRTIREAHIMMLLKHPNIVGMKDLVLQGPYFYILMDYVNGGQLLHYIVKRQRLSDRRTRQFSRQIVSALDYLHRNSIVHRDLKIENIMIDKSGRHIKIIDFGLSNLFCPERQLTTYCGSLYFAAPELLKATPYSGPEVDVWSLGVVIYVMATGSVPFDDKSMPGLHDKIKRGQVTYPAHLSDECKNLLSRIFVTEPSQRIIMTDIIHHPWMNKDAAPINNYMPPSRKPLKMPLNPKVIERMSQGFNLGSPEEIERRLTLIIQSPVYHDAMKHISDCHARKTLTPPLNYGEINFGIVYDDPQSVPAAYHPFLSLYYLASEKLAATEYEAHHHRVPIRSSLSRKASVESMGGYSSARSSQASLVGADEHTTSNGPRLLTEVPLSHTPVIPPPTSGFKLPGNGSMSGFVSQPAAIGSTNYLSRIQRWLRSSLSTHHLVDESKNSANHISAPPSPPQRVEDAEVDPIMYNSSSSANTSRLPTPSHSTDDKGNTASHSPNESFHSASNVETLSTTDKQQHQQQSAAPNGSKSLFRKLSHAVFRKNSSKSLNKKTSNLSATNTTSDQNTSEEEVASVSIVEPDDQVPPPVPPKDFKYTYMAVKANRNSQQLPPGMSIATVTSRQTAHTIDISAININSPNTHTNGTGAITPTTSNFTTTPTNLHTNPNSSHIPTPIASKMAKYDDVPQVQNQQSDNGYLSQPTPNISRSASMATHHRRRGSVSKLTGKIGSWLNRSSSFNQHGGNSSRLNKQDA
ncbi:kinase-like domain-containing protein [Mucor lusitanicus]|uniref:Kinase-like domain-containing protein n=1 Tax=Mucor circinelloides f. lusitanicus TaxID=29924 RepID=A0A8H4F699_MUCCL|nr:kinase-like domain-containing protein [Mucor lusitanicus]